MHTYHPKLHFFLVRLTKVQKFDTALFDMIKKFDTVIEVIGKPSTIFQSVTVLMEDNLATSIKYKCVFPT